MELAYAGGQGHIARGAFTTLSHSCPPKKAETCGHIKLGTLYPSLHLPTPNQGKCLHVALQWEDILIASSQQPCMCACFCLQNVYWRRRTQFAKKLLVHLGKGLPTIKIAPTCTYTPPATFCFQVHTKGHAHWTTCCQSMVPLLCYSKQCSDSFGALCSFQFG